MAEHDNNTIIAILFDAHRKLESIEVELHLRNSCGMQKRLPCIAVVGAYYMDTKW